MQAASLQHCADQEEDKQYSARDLQFGESPLYLMLSVAQISREPRTEALTLRGWKRG